MHYEELAAAGGTEFRSRRRTITETDAVTFTCMTGIMDPVFTDEIFAQENLFGGRVVPGPMIMTYAMGLTDDLGYSSVVAALGVEARFVAPVRPKDTIHVVSRVAEARESKSRPDAGIVTLAHDVRNQDGTLVQQFSRTLLVLKKSAAESQEVPS
nr:MaoC family dehydratase [Amycolatopsis jejuensis]